MTARRRSGRGVLVITALLLAASGALRLGDGIGAALAARGPVDEGADGGAPLACPAPPALLAAALHDRAGQLDAREAALDARDAALRLAGEVIDKRLAELAAAEAELSGTLARADGAMEGDLVRLTAVYETMKPKEAAAIFSAMAPEFAAGFLARMRPDAAAAVLAGMAPDAAYGISVLMAGRNALVPRE